MTAAELQEAPWTHHQHATLVAPLSSTLAQR